jgi:hypothetical protein
VKKMIRKLMLIPAVLLGALALAGCNHDSHAVAVRTYEAPDYGYYYYQDGGYGYYEYPGQYRYYYDGRQHYYRGADGKYYYRGDGKYYYRDRDDYRGHHHDRDRD